MDSLVGLTEVAEDEGEDSAKFVEAWFDGADGVLWRVVPFPVSRPGFTAVFVVDPGGPSVDCGAVLEASPTAVVVSRVGEGFDVGAAGGIE